jgi:hypothetical protein
MGRVHDFAYASNRATRLCPPYAGYLLLRAASGRPGSVMKLRRFIRSARSLRHTTGHAGAFSAFFFL